MSRSIKISAGTRGKKGKTHGPHEVQSPQIITVDGKLKITVEQSGRAHGGEAAGFLGIANTHSYSVTRFGEVEIGKMLTVELFEAALDDGVKLTKAETQRLLAKIIHCSVLFDD